MEHGALCSLLFSHSQLVQRGTLSRSMPLRDRMFGAPRVCGPAARGHVHLPTPAGSTASPGGRRRLAAGDEEPTVEVEQPRMRGSGRSRRRSQRGSMANSGTLAALGSSQGSAPEVDDLPRQEEEESESFISSLSLPLCLAAFSGVLENKKFLTP